MYYLLFLCVYVCISIAKKIDFKKYIYIIVIYDIH